VLLDKVFKVPKVFKVFKGPKDFKVVKDIKVVKVPKVIRQKKKKGALAAPYAGHRKPETGNCPAPPATSRPIYGQDTTGIDNYYTGSNPLERGSYVCVWYKELFTLYSYVRRLCRIVIIP